MERGWGIRRGWYVVAFILAAGLVGAGVALGGIYREVRGPYGLSFYRINRFTGETVECWSRAGLCDRFQRPKARKSTIRQ